MSYVLGGYYLVKLRPLTFGTREGSLIHTASDCINENLVGAWSYPSTGPLDKEAREAKSEFGFSDDKLASLRNWVGVRLTDGSIEWPSVFSNAASAIDYKSRFFSNAIDTDIFALYFDENETCELIDEFKPESEGGEGVGIYQNLIKRTAECENKSEQLVGYDLIGIEHGGDFHTFHCHDIGAELSTRFDLTLNDYGLFEDCGDWKPVLDYLNDEENGCEPVPWFVAKVKMVAVT